MRRTRLCGAVLVAAALLLSACSEEDGATPEPVTSTSAASEEATASVDGIDVCARVTGEQMEEALGGPVRLEEIPGGGCTFTQTNPVSLSASLDQTALDDLTAGFEGTRSGVASIIDGEVVELPDVGDAAFVVAGPSLDGTLVSGGGAVLLGDAIVQVTLLQGDGLSADAVEELTAAVVTLVGTPA